MDLIAFMKDFDVTYHNVSHVIRKRTLINLGQLAVYCRHLQNHYDQRAMCKR